MKKALIALVLAMMAAAAMLAALVFVGIKGVSSREMTPEEGRLVLTVSSLDDFGVAYSDDENCERSVARLQLDGSLELEYKYDSDRDPQAEFLYFVSDAEINRSVREAKESLAMQIGACKLGALLVKGRTIREQSDLFTLGEDNYSAVIEQDGDVIGNIVVARQGTIVHSLLTLGVFFSEREDIEDLLRPVLTESQKREP